MAKKEVFQGFIEEVGGHFVKNMKSASLGVKSDCDLHEREKVGKEVDEKRQDSIITFSENAIKGKE